MTIQHYDTSLIPPQRISAAQFAAAEILILFRNFTAKQHFFC